MHADCVVNKLNSPARLGEVNCWTNDLRRSKDDLVRMAIAVKFSMQQLVDCAKHDGSNKFVKTNEIPSEDVRRLEHLRVYRNNVVRPILAMTAWPRTRHVVRQLYML